MTRMITIPDSRTEEQAREALAAVPWPGDALIRRETVPLSGPVVIDAALLRSLLPSDECLTPRFKTGDRVVLTCEGKAECGGTGVVASVRPYGGPRMYAHWEYDLSDGLWHGRHMRWSGIRETWLALAEEAT
jgi:hypothetical protein